MVTRGLKRFLPLVLLLAILTVGLTRASFAVDVGERAPDFTLPSTTGERISLSQFRGKKLVLLAFYIRDFGAT